MRSSPLLRSSLVIHLPQPLRTGLPPPCWALSLQLHPNPPGPSASHPKCPPRSPRMKSSLLIFCAEEAVPLSWHWAHSHAGRSSPPPTMSSLKMGVTSASSMSHPASGPPPHWLRTGFDEALAELNILAEACPHWWLGLEDWARTRWPKQAGETRGQVPECGHWTTDSLGGWSQAGISLCPDSQWWTWHGAGLLNPDPKRVLLHATFHMALQCDIGCSKTGNRSNMEEEPARGHLVSRGKGRNRTRTPTGLPSLPDLDSQKLRAKKDLSGLSQPLIL